MAVEQYSLKELEELIKGGANYRLFKPFFFKGQILLNIEKLLTIKDIMKLEGKVFGPIEVVTTVEHNTDDRIRKAIISNAITILKTSNRFKVDETHHLDFTKRKECEKLLDGIINGNPHLAQQLLKIYKFSKKLFIHSIHVGIIATVIDLGIQQKNKHHDGLRSEELLTGALLHDVGLLAYPSEIIEKKRIDLIQSNEISYKAYPVKGKEMMEKLHDSIRKKSINIIYQHQERLMGNGFPEGLKGHHIDDLALIVGLADEFDLLLNNELSSVPKTASEIMSRISRMSNFFGSHIVDSFYTWFRYLK
ncbi:MAG: HD domain-containing protein [Spirochaetes bacterium]|nr:HD domain-containing protein [Spirochaetota bacterium]